MLRLILLFAALTAFCVGCNLGEQEIEVPPAAYFTVKIDSDYQAYVIPPGSYSRTVDYDGIDAERVFAMIDLSASLNSTHDILTLKVNDKGTQEIKRLWAVAVETQNLVLLNPDAVNKKNQGVLVFGPFASKESITRNLQVQILAVPALLKIDFLEVKDRIVWSSSKGLSLSRRIWDMNLDGEDRFQVTTGTEEIIHQTYPSWSPGMEWIEFDELDYGAAPEEYGNRVYIIHPDGASKRPVSPAGKWSEQAVFTPSGKALVYSCSARQPESNSDICLAEIKGDYEIDLVRGDGFYWDGDSFEQFTSMDVMERRAITPKLTVDGKYLFFTLYENTLAGIPVAQGYRPYMFVMPFDPVMNRPAAPPRLLARLYDADTISNAQRYVQLNECFPSFSPDGKNMFCFLREFVRTSPTTFPQNFYGIARVKIEELLAAGSNVYFGDYMERVFDIRAYQKSINAYYLNFPDYIAEQNRIIFNSQFNDFMVVIDALELDEKFQPKSSPGNLLWEISVNFTPRLPPPMIRGFYRE